MAYLLTELREPRGGKECIPWLGEAEAKDIDDAQAIAHVIVNRMRLPNWPDSAAEVCLQPWQFSCWNKNDPNFAYFERREADPVPRTGPSMDRR